MKVVGTLLLSIASVLPLSAAHVPGRQAVAPDAATDSENSPRAGTHTPFTLVEIGACNPRVELCEGRVDGDDAADGGRNATGDERRDRGWLSGIACNPRVKVCES